MLETVKDRIVTKAIMWFRQDLRLEDNPALVHASKAGDVIPIYILDNSLKDPWPAGAASKWWLFHSLKSLITAGVPLVLYQGDPMAILKSVIAKTGASSLYWNRVYEPYAIERDALIQQALSIKTFSYNGSLLFEPWTITNKQGSFFKVFTPFWKTCLSVGSPRDIVLKPKVTYAEHSVENLQLEQLNLLPLKKDWPNKFNEYWQPGEKGAQKKIADFLSEALGQYKKARDFPSKPFTSRLSPHLHYGEVSPHQVLQAVQMHCLQAEDSIQHFIAELGWREFSYYLLYHFPALPHTPFQHKFSGLPWQKDEQLFNHWKKGKTGYPIIDAGMRELWSTGYMHNRVRMIVASFLTKHCLIPWQDGEAWFWETLVDADLANNAASWQWVAGCGADASPYFRIFNPVLQSQRFDANAEYIKKWVPELSKFPIKYIHAPWSAPMAEQHAAQTIIGQDYPYPIVKLELGRARALAAYQNL